MKYASLTRRQWIGATADFRQQLPFPLQPLRNLVFAIDIFQNVAIDYGIVIGAAKDLEHPMKAPEMLAPQQSRCVEVLVREGT